MLTHILIFFFSFTCRPHCITTPQNFFSLMLKKKDKKQKIHQQLCTIPNKNNYNTKFYHYHTITKEILLMHCTTTYHHVPTTLHHYHDHNNKKSGGRGSTLLYATPIILKSRNSTTTTTTTLSGFSPVWQDLSEKFGCPVLSGQEPHMPSLVEPYTTSHNNSYDVSKNTTTTKLKDKQLMVQCWKDEI